MKFLVDNFIAILMVFALFMSEYFHLLFDNIPFNERITLDHAVFYLTFSFFGSGLLTSVIVFLMTETKKIASRTILAGVIFWNLIECLENYLYLAKVNTNVLIINDGSWLQIFTMLCIMSLSFYGFKKFNS